MLMHLTEILPNVIFTWNNYLLFCIDLYFGFLKHVLDTLLVKLQQQVPTRVARFPMTKYGRLLYIGLSKPRSAQFVCIVPCISSTGYSRVDPGIWLRGRMASVEYKPVMGSRAKPLVRRQSFPLKQKAC